MKASVQFGPRGHHGLNVPKHVILDTKIELVHVTTPAWVKCVLVWPVNAKNATPINVHFSQIGAYQNVRHHVVEVKSLDPVHVFITSPASTNATGQLLSSSIATDFLIIF